MLIRLVIVALVGLLVWAVAWALRRYAANATTPERFDTADGVRGDATTMLVTFSGPYCLECHEILPRLQAASAAHAVPLKVIDIKESPELAAKYDVRLTPTTFVVGSGGNVQAGWLGTPPEGAVEEALATVGGESKRGAESGGGGLAFR
jgi:thioredoxin-like negative regulator of GroEL